MENLEKHYMLLLPKEDQEFLKIYLENLLLESNSLHQYLQKICALLLKKPYPVLEILLLKWSHSKYYIKRVLLNTFEELLNEALTNGFNLRILKFLNKIPEEILQNSLQGKLREQMRKCLLEAKLDKEFYLSLISRETTKSMNDILELLKETQWQYFHKPLATKEYILYQALDNKAHFLTLMGVQITDFKNIKDLQLRNNLIILKLVEEFSMTSHLLQQLPNVEQCLESFDVANLTEDLRPVYDFFYKDFKRVTIILNYVQKFPEMASSITVENILSTTSNLEIMNRYKLLNSYEEAKLFIDSYYMWQNSVNISLKDYELETVCYYFILSCIYDIIVTSAAIVSKDEFYIQKLQSLNALLRQMKNFELLCQILEDVLKFTYLRWEHLHKDSTIEKQPNKFIDSSDTSNTDDDLLSEKLSKPKNKETKSGFICKSNAFSQLFNFLKIFVTKKLHSADFKNSCSDNQRRFQNIVDYITDILWKYSLLEKLEQSQNQTNPNDNLNIYLNPEYIHHFVCYHIDLLEHVSSDDDENHQHYHSHYSSFSRRKAAKKRRRATFSGSVTTPQGELSLQQYRARANVLADSSMDPIKRLPITRNVNHITEERSIIPKLLGSPERLAVLALSLKRFNDAKLVIENFNLQSSQLNTELNFVEQQQQIKQKLSIIYDNYQQQEKQSRNTTNEPLATVEQIRNVAAKGFEVSKIISVIDNFAQAQRIKQTESVKELIQKHKQNPQYRFLTQFEETNLNAVIICDLILNLPLNRDIITSVLMVIKRHQSIQSTFKEPESVEKLQFPKNIGPLSLLENLNDCMRLLGDKSVRDLLSDNTYSLRPQKLSLELEREKIFTEVFYKKPADLTRCDDLKSLQTNFQNLKSKCNYYQRFCNYINHLTKLNHLRDPNCEYHIDELLKLDPCDVIGELIFSRNMTPLEIEANVTALNLNLVHVISINICPEIVGKCGLQKGTLTPQKQATIFNYISNYNRLLVYLLQGINNCNYFSHNDPNINSKFLERILHMSEIERLSTMYGGNKVIAALRSDHINMKLLQQIDSKKEQLQLLQLEMGIQEPNAIKSKRIDCLVIQLIQEDAKNIYLSSKIHDIAVRANLIHKNFTKIATTRLAKELIETTLQHRQAVQKIPKELRQQLEATLADITIYAKVSEVMQFETWPQAYDFGLKTPSTVFERLLHLHLYKLCYEWCKVVKLADNFKPQRKNLLNILLEALMDMSDDQQSQDLQLNTYEYLLHILETFPQADCVLFLDSNKDKFRSMVLIKYSIRFLERFAKAHDKEIYKNYKISIIIFEQLPPGIRKQFWNLFKFPLLIIEQLIMNAKFEVMTKVLSLVRKELQRDSNVDGRDGQKLCPFCFDKHGYIYDIQAKTNSSTKSRFQLGSVESTNASAFILLNFNLYQKDHFITNDCVDLLLRIYATKALDYQISDTSSSSEPCSQSTFDMQQSLDSLCGTFQMPDQAPVRTEWIRDEEATNCMCCRRAAFTMLMRRHHCRRCGRVVCFACSTHRLRIPELYEDVEVRICNDCHRLCEDNMQRKSNRDSAQPDDLDDRPVKTRQKPAERFKWKLSGNITHDKLLREEFCYEHAPSVALCLSILEYHLGKQKCVDLLIFHCRKLEKLIVPNPEVDYELVAKMMNCLALAAKVRGAPAEVETIREHSDIIISVVQNGCESLIPPDPFNNHGLRKLADSLVQAERWDLALEVHLKFGYSTAGVMAAHGLSCLRVGCFDTAREKFYHCMPKLTNESTNLAISKIIFNTNLVQVTNDNYDNVLGLTKDLDVATIKRPQHGPPLLQEILKLIDSLPFNKTQPETLQRASIIRSSNSSLVSLLSRRKETYVKRMHEPALNILNTLANLKRISKGQYSLANTTSTNNNDTPIKRKMLFRKTCGFEECIYYVLTYGSHADIIQFLMLHNDIMTTLKYYLLQKLDADYFIHHIFLELLKKGRTSELINVMQEFDSRFFIWRSTLLHTCRYLETQNLLNSLYQLQVLLNDPIRASMTCVKFYAMNCENFQQQHLNAQHLHNAHLHLQTELENAQWENITFNTSKAQQKTSISRRSSSASTTSMGGSVGGGTFLLQMDAKALNAHINTILKQLDVAKFLAKCEMENSTDVVPITEKFLKQLRLESNKTLPTLFDNVQEKIQICILILLCGKNIDEGFGLVYRIIQDYKLPPMKIFAATAKYLARNQRLTEVDKLLNCITSNNDMSTRDIDEILSVAINSAINNHEPEVKTALDNLTKKINSVELRIASHIFIGQLKSAYLLANKYKRLADIRKILRQAEATNQIHIKKLCEKKLQMSMSGTSPPN